MDNTNDLDQKILQLRQVEGMTIKDIIKELKIKYTDYQKSIDKLKSLKLYDEKEVEKAKKRKKSREYYHKHKNEKHLHGKEEEYRKECIDIMCRRYFNYNQIGKFNPVLVDRLKRLNDIASYNTVLNTIKAQIKSLDYANTKNFASETQKISYMIAIIRNNLSNTLKKMEINEKLAKKNRIDEEIIKEINKERECKPSKRFDMTEFLDD